MQLVVKESSTPITTPKIHRLTLFNQQVQELINILTIDAEDMVESNLTIAILKADKYYNISFDQSSCRVELMEVGV